MTDKDKAKLVSTEKRKADQETEPTKDLKKVSVNRIKGVKTLCINETMKNHIKFIKMLIKKR